MRGMLVGAWLFFVAVSAFFTLECCFSRLHRIQEMAVHDKYVVEENMYMFSKIRLTKGIL
jgi:hypothetical protein